MDITDSFLKGIQGCEQYNEALDIIKKNSFGKIWVIGGFVYRSIAHQLYGLDISDVDLDFIVEKPVKIFDLPPGWNVEINRFGNPKFVNGEKQIDYIPLDKIYSIMQRDIEPKIENFLSGVPLTIQAVVFDVMENVIMGDQGIDAMNRRIVEVNDLHFARYAALMKSKSLHELIQEKAYSLGFTPIYPE